MKSILLLSCLLSTTVGLGSPVYPSPVAAPPIMGHAPSVPPLVAPSPSIGRSPALRASVSRLVAADAPPAAPPLLGTAARQLVRKEGQAAGKVDGKALYGVYCTNCHGPEGNGDGVAAASLNPRPKPFRESLKGRKDEELLDIMARGRGQMPGWGNVLSDEQLKAILGYIKELAKK